MRDEVTELLTSNDCLVIGDVEMLNTGIVVYQVLVSPVHIPAIGNNAVMSGSFPISLSY